MRRGEGGEEYRSYTTYRTYAAPPPNPLSHRRNLVLVVAQVLGGFQDDLVVDLALEEIEAVALFVVEKVGDIGVEPDDDALAVLQLGLLFRSEERRVGKECRL